MRERPRDKARLEHIINACDIVADAIKNMDLNICFKTPFFIMAL